MIVDAAAAPRRGQREPGAMELGERGAERVGELGRDLVGARCQPSRHANTLTHFARAAAARTAGRRCATSGGGVTTPRGGERGDEARLPRDVGLRLALVDAHEARARAR